MKLSIRPVLLILLLCTGCSGASNGLEQVKGNGLTFSENFNAYDGLDERENVKFYKATEKAELTLPSLSQESLMNNGIETESLPFEVVDKNAYVVTSEDAAGKLSHQAQLSYLGASEEGSVDEFFVISVTEMDKNPVDDYKMTGTVDSVGNSFKTEPLIGENVIFQQVLTTDSALMFRYYDFDESEKRVIVVGTAANEYYAYHEGFVYHIGYLIDRQSNTEQVQNDMLNLTRNLILGKEHSS